MSERSAAVMDRNLALEAVRITEATALAASRLMGRGDERAADEAAVEAMHSALNTLNVRGTVIIGEGEPDEAERLFNGQQIGAAQGDPTIDIILSPLEGSTICAKGGYNALAVMAMAGQGAFLNAPAVYMDKIAVGPGLPPGVVDLDETPHNNLKRLAEAKQVPVSDLLICILDRPRHEDLIDKVREAGARVMLIADGDVSGVIATALPDTGVDMYVGVGGAREGVLAAAALACMGGQMQGRLVCRNEDDRNRALRRGIADLSHKYDMAEMAKGDVMFAATGVTDGVILRGVRRSKGRATTHSMVVRSTTGTVRFIDAQHDSERKAGHGWLGR